MQGEEYCAMFIANYIDYVHLSAIKAEYEVLYSKLVPFLKSELSFNESSSEGITKTFTKSLSTTISSSKSNALSTGTSESTGTAYTEGSSTIDSMGSNIGINQGKSISSFKSDTLSGSLSTGLSIGQNINVGVNGIGGGMNTSESLGMQIGKSVSKGVSDMLTSGIGGGINYSHGITRSKSYTNSSTFGTTRSQISTIGKTEAKGEIDSRSEGKTESETTGRSLQISYINKTIQELLNKIDDQLKRIKEGENYGMFAAAGYFLAKDPATASMAAGAYKSLINGNSTNVERSYINSWMDEDGETKNACATTIKKYLKMFRHPEFTYDKNNTVTPATVISGRELALQFGMPRKSVPGVAVTEMAAFGRNVQKNKTYNSKRTLSLGNIYHMGIEEAAPVELDLESLTIHTFITGSTGSGKSNTVYHMLDEVKRQGVNFLVIEPAKGEYKDVFGNRDDVSVYGTNNKKTDLLRINPFSFPEDVHVLEHIDRLIEIFNVCWPMYAAMPAVLKDAVERAYIKAGWDLNESECKYVSDEGVKLYPGFVDVLQQINVVMEESKYSSDSKGDYTGALCTRVKSLTNGLYSQIFTADELSDEELYNENVIVDLSRVGSTETKSLIMGLLVMKMQEYRMSARTGSNSQLKHLTVLEEAHNLLKRTSTKQSSETSNLLGKSVEMLANSIAEMRTYGEGFIIADQSPGLLDMSVIRNTNTKIILRLPDLSDRELVGRAAALNDDQITELSKLETGVAAVYQNNWLEPVLCRVKLFEDMNGGRFSYEGRDSSNYGADKKVDLVKYIMNPTYEKFGFDKHEIKNLEKSVYKMNLTAETKTCILKYIKETDTKKRQDLTNKIIYGIFNSETALSASNAERKNIKLWYDIMLEALNPDISSLDETERDMILSIIVNKYNEIKHSEVSTELYNNFFGYINEINKKGGLI